MNKLHLILALTFAVGAAFGACSGGSDGGGGTAPPIEDVSFADDIQPIFNSSCTSSQCHGADESAGKEPKRSERRCRGAAACLPLRSLRSVPG